MFFVFFNHGIKSEAFHAVSNWNHVKNKNVFYFTFHTKNDIMVLFSLQG